jgi:hypothetical protein
VDPLGIEGKKKLGSYFKGGKAILEGGLRGPSTSARTNNGSPM